MEDVAKAAGVTPMTVSRSFSHPHLVSEKTRAAVLAAADRLAYVPNRTAGTLRSQTSKMIGLLIPSLSDATYHRVFAGIVEAVSASGYQVVVAETRYSGELELSTLRQILGWRPAGFVLTGADHSPESIKLLESARIPVCCVMQVARKSQFSTLGFSNAGAMRALARHLVERGRRRLVFVRPKGVAHQRLAQRLAAVREVVSAAPGVSFEVLELDRPAPFTLHDGAAAVDLSLAMHPGVEALMFSNDLPAAGAVLHCKRIGIDVPGQLAITGLGDLDIATMVDPQLTTVRLPVQEMGSAAGRYLLEALTTGRAEPQHLDIGFEIQVRDSA